jgi:hypothetical protein
MRWLPTGNPRNSGDKSKRLLPICGWRDSNAHYS